MFAEAVVRRPGAGEKKGRGVDDDEKRRRVAFLESFVIDV